MLNRDEDKLGEGQFATVRKAIQKKTGKVVAVKCILVSNLTKEDEDALKIEIEVMKMVRFLALYPIVVWLPSVNHPSRCCMLVLCAPVSAGFLSCAGNVEGFRCCRASQLNHPNLVTFIDYFEDPEYNFLVMELMTGGELFTRIVEKVRTLQAIYCQQRTDSPMYACVVFLPGEVLGAGGPKGH
jgi:serine/threonine protein kinase